MRSMTGFGRATGGSDTYHIEVSVRSVNHKGLDIRTTTPPGADPWEVELRRAVKARVARGRVEVRVDVRSATEGDDAALEAWVERLRRLKRRHGLEGLLTIQDVLLTFTPETSAAAIPAWDDVAPVVEEALSAHEGFRKREGAGLKVWFLTQLSALREVLVRVDERRPEAVAEQATRLRQRVSRLVSEASQALDERVAAEIVVLADRSDIEEEVQRATAHLDALAQTLALPYGEPRGKRLDFVLQELIRETNTMASKSVDPQIRGWVVDAKTLVDQMREQAANAE